MANKTAKPEVKTKKTAMTKAKATDKKGTLKPLDASDLTYLANLKPSKPVAGATPTEMFTHFTPLVRKFVERKDVTEFLGKKAGLDKVGGLTEQASRASEVKAKLTVALGEATQTVASANKGLYDIASSLNDAREDLATEFGDDAEQLQALFDWWDTFHARTKAPKVPPAA